MSITIDLPAPLLTALQQKADANGRTIEEALIAAVCRGLKVALTATGEPETEEPDWEIVAYIEEAEEDARAGRLLTIEEVSAHMEEVLAEARKRREEQINTAAAIAA